MPSKELHLFIKYTWFLKRKMHVFAPGEHFIGIYNKWLIHLAPILTVYKYYIKCYTIKQGNK